MNKFLCKDGPCPITKNQVCCWQCPAKSDCGVVCGWVCDEHEPGDCGNMEEG